MANEPDDADLRRIARLARLELRDEEVPRLRADLSGLLRFVEELDALDVEGVEPMFHARDRCPLRDDSPTQGEASADELLAAAPRVVDRGIAVPKVLEADS